MAKNTATILRNEQVHIWICFRTHPSLHWKIKGVREVGSWHAMYWEEGKLPKIVESYVNGRTGSHRIHRAFAARCLHNNFPIHLDRVGSWYTV
jgi:hypothetical protein